MRTDCRICHGTRLELILKLAPTPIGDEFLLVPKEQPLHPIDLYQCQDCGLAQLLYEIPPEEIYKDYLYLTGSSVGLDEHFAQYARRVATVCNLQSDDLVVDIGSNDGTLLKHFKALGMNVLGYEPCEAIADVARRAGIGTVSAYFDDKQPEYAADRRGYHVKAKLITANNVVANMNDLDSFMRGVLRLLDDEGTFVFESFYLGDVVRNMVFDFIYHEHLSAFSIRPVKALMRRYGMRLYKTEHLKTKGGSIRYYCTRYYAGRNQNEVEDDDERLYEKETYVEFTRKIETEKQKTLGFVRHAKAKGARIAGFGACISGTTLLYNSDLGPYLDFLIDDNPAKVGTFSPGLHLRVMETGAALDVDYVLCLAWRFAEDFKRAHPHVKLIVPLPRFHVA